MTDNRPTIEVSTGKSPARTVTRPVTEPTGSVGDTPVPEGRTGPRSTSTGASGAVTLGGTVEPPGRSDGRSAARTPSVATLCAIAPDSVPAAPLAGAGTAGTGTGTGREGGDVLFESALMAAMTAARRSGSPASEVTLRCTPLSVMVVPGVMASTARFSFVVPGTLPEMPAFAGGLAPVALSESAWSSKERGWDPRAPSTAGVRPTAGTGWSA